MVGPLFLDFVTTPTLMDNGSGRPFLKLIEPANILFE